MNFDHLKTVDQWVCWDDKTGRKVPLQVGGGAASSTNPTTWTSYDKAVEYAEANGLRGVGFVFTKDDEYCGVDIDDCIDYDGIVSEEAMQIVDELNSYTEISPSGTGLKIFGRCKDVLKGRNKDGLEAYTFGRFFTVTGNVLGDQYKLSDIGGYVGRLLRKEEPRPPVHRRGAVQSTDYGQDRVEKASLYLAQVDPAIEGQNGDRQLFVACSAMVVRFGLNQHDAMHLLMTEYNHRCDPPWEHYAVERKVEQLLRDRESDPHYLSKVSEDNVTRQPLDDNHELVANLLASKESEPLPQRFIDDLPAGPIRVMYDYILATSARESTGIAFSGALSWYCGLLAGKVMDESGTKTNLYSITLAPSSAGKQAPQDAIRAVSDGAGSDWVSGKVTSDSAIGSVLRTNANSMCLWDEVGIFFQKSRGGVQGTITDLLLDLWGAVNSKFRLKQYADSEKDIVIDRPCFGFHGWSTVDHFWAGLTRMHLRDGFAGRLLVFDTGPRAERKRKKYQEAPESLVEVDKWLSNLGIGPLEEAGLNDRPKAMMIKVTEEAEQVFDALWDKVEAFENDDDQSIWGRAPEKARKIALALACQRGLDTEVTMADAQYACDLVDHLTEQFVVTARKRLTVGENFTEVKQELITELKRRNGVASWTGLLKAVGCSESVFSKAIKTLESTGQIAIKFESNNRRKVVYRG